MSITYDERFVVISLLWADLETFFYRNGKPKIKHTPMYVTRSDV